MIVFRTDASIEIGTGHVARCITLAKILQAQGKTCHFICRELPGNLIDFIESENLGVSRLPAPVKLADDIDITSLLGVPWKHDANECKKILATLQVERVIVDHYGLDEQWENRVLESAAVKLMVIDDLANRKHHCDILLDQTLGRKKSDYDQLIPQSSVKLVGPKFALLRTEFSKLRNECLSRRKQMSLNKILITMGGIDKDNVTSQVLDVLNKCQLSADVKIVVVTGANFPHFAELRKLEAQLSLSVEILVNVTNMAEIMCEADLAIGAAGTTSWERCCMGLPSLALVLADNQIESANALDNAGAAIMVGDVRHTGWKEVLERQVNRLKNSQELLNLSQNAHLLCDGYGSIRVGENIVSAPFIARLANENDALAIWQWRESDGAYKYYESKKPTPFVQHHAWFARALNCPSKRLLIIERNDTRIAHVRFDMEENNSKQALISISMASQYKGTGLALDCLQCALDDANTLGIGKITAYIHEDNIPSTKLFCRGGFTHVANNGKFSIYEYEQIRAADSVAKVSER